MTATLPNRLTMRLLSQLRDIGFTAPAEAPSWIGQGEGYVEHPATGTWIQVSSDMLRLIVAASDDLPEYRLILAWRDLSEAEALRIIGIHARAALAGKEN